MPKLIPLESVVERAIRNTLTDLKGLEPADRIAAIKLGIELVKVQKLTAKEKFGAAFLDNLDDPDDLEDPEGKTNE